MVEGEVDQIHPKLALGYERLELLIATAQAIAARNPLRGCPDFPVPPTKARGSEPDAIDARKNITFGQSVLS
jgi:hypothetical protein